MRISSALVGTIALVLAACGSPRAPQLTKVSAVDTVSPADFAWWRDARFGMFVHWGLYSEAGGVWKNQFLPGWSEWMLNRKRISPGEYHGELTPRFDPVDFDADAWVIAAKSAGMKYIVVTTKHHEGFAMWQSATGNQNISSTPFGKPKSLGGRGRDPMRELADACARHDVRLGFYYSLLDWSHPDYLPRREWDTRPTDGASYARYTKFMRDQVRELLDGRYGKISILWGDGDWEHGAQEHTSDEIVAMARQLQPGILVNDRWAQAGDYATPENKIPETGLARPWETCMTLNGSWGYARDDHDFKSAAVVLENLADIVSKGGNYLLNIGPDGRGRIDAQSRAVLESMAIWMRTHSSSIHGNGRALLQTPAWGRWTMSDPSLSTVTLNAHLFTAPQSAIVRLDGVIDDPVAVRVIGGEYAVGNVRRDGPDLLLDLSPIAIEALGRTSPHSVIAFDFHSQPRILTAPTILSDERIFVGATRVRFLPPPSGATIRATTDGSQPTIDTPPVQADESGEFSVVIDATTTVRARMSWNGALSGAETAMIFAKVELSPARACGDAGGMRAAVILGEFQDVPRTDAFALSTPSTIVESVCIPPGVPADRFAIQLCGSLQVVVNGIYRFEISSDDGSELWIDGQRIIDNGGLHGATPKTGDVALAAGCHDLEVRMFESVGSEALTLRWRTPLVSELAPIPSTVLRHTNAPIASP